MVDLKRSVVVTSILLGVSLSDVSYAQHTYNPRTVTQLSEVFEDAKREQTYCLGEGIERVTALSDMGLLVVRHNLDDSIIIRTIDDAGTIVWEKRHEDLDRLYVTASPDGHFVLLFHTDRHLSEGNFELITSEGQTLWTRHAVARPHFLRSGDNLLLKGTSFLEQPDGVVVDIRSGKEQWRIDETYRIWEWGPGLVACLEKKNNTISVVDPTVGRSLWIESIESTFLTDFEGAPINDIIPSEDGKRLVLTLIKSLARGTSGVSHNRWKTRIGSFNQFGRLLWSRDVDGHVTPIGITPDSRFIAARIFRPHLTQLSQARQLELIDANTGTVIWTLEYRAWGGLPVLMNNRLLLTADGGLSARGGSDGTGGSLILSIDSSGQLQDQAHLPHLRVRYVGFRNDLQTHGNQLVQRTVLLFGDGRSTPTLHVESIRR